MKHIIKPLEAEVKQVDNLIGHYTQRSKEAAKRADEARAQAAVHDAEAVEHAKSVEDLSARKSSLVAVIGTVKSLS